MFINGGNNNGESINNNNISSAGAKQQSLYTQSNSIAGPPFYGNGVLNNHIVTTQHNKTVGMPFTIPSRNNQTMSPHQLNPSSLMHMNNVIHLQQQQQHQQQQQQQQQQHHQLHQTPTLQPLPNTVQQQQQQQANNIGHSLPGSQQLPPGNNNVHSLYTNMIKAHMPGGLLCAQSTQQSPQHSAVYRTNNFVNTISSLYGTASDQTQSSPMLHNAVLPLQPKQLSHQNLPASAAFPSHHSLKMQPYSPHHHMAVSSPHKSQPYQLASSGHPLSLGGGLGKMTSVSSTANVAMNAAAAAAYHHQNVLTALMSNQPSIMNLNLPGSPLTSSPTMHHLYQQTHQQQHQLNNQNNPNLLNRTPQPVPCSVNRNLLQALSVLDANAQPNGVENHCTPSKLLANGTQPTHVSSANNHMNGINQLNNHHLNQLNNQLNSIGLPPAIHAPAFQSNDNSTMTSQMNGLHSGATNSSTNPFNVLTNHLLPNLVGSHLTSAASTPSTPSRTGNSTLATVTGTPVSNKNAANDRQSGVCSQQQQQQLTNQINAILNSSVNTSGIIGQLSFFQIVKQIGSGQFSVVYRAAYLPTGQPVALKCIRIFELNDMKTRLDCINEISLLQRLNHTNIVRYHTSFLEANSLYIVLELADCGDLAQLLKHFRKVQRSIPERTIWQYFRQIANGLMHMHENCILHRDIKPPNVFISQKGVIKLGDLGLSKYYGANCNGHCCCADGRGSCLSNRSAGLRASPLKSANGVVAGHPNTGGNFNSLIYSSGGGNVNNAMIAADQITGHRQQHFMLHRQLMHDEANSLIGTPYYMAPERIQENHKYDSQSDIWSLGCILYEMAALQSPFFGEKLNLFSLCRKIVCCNYPPLPKDQYSVSLRSLISACLNADPRQRPSIELICDIAKYCSGKKYMIAMSLHV